MSDNESNNGQPKQSAASKQEELFEECKKQGYRAPVYQHVSDRRGGRTAWSATVELQGQTFSARFWYDGQHVDNAREDVADLVLTYIKSSPGSLAGKEGASFPSFSRAERERFANH